MRAISIKLSDPLEPALEALAKVRGQNRSDVSRGGIEAFAAGPVPSVLDAIRRLVDCLCQEGRGRPGVVTVSAGQ